MRRRRAGPLLRAATEELADKGFIVTQLDKLVELGAHAARCGR